MLFPLATIICVAALMVIVYFFAVLEQANKGFWDAVLPNLGWILPVGILGGLVWSVRISCEAASPCRAKQR